jgi:hypothetical protein
LSKAPGLLIAIALMALFDLGVYWSERSRRKQLARLGEAFDGAVAKTAGGLFSKRRVEGTFCGRPVRLMLNPGGRAQPGYPIACVTCSSRMDFEFFTSAAVQIGRSKHAFQLGDPEVDRKFTFISQDSGGVRTWLLQPENMKNVIAMLRLRSSLELKSGFLTWKIWGFWRAVEDTELSSATDRGSLHDGKVVKPRASQGADLEREGMRQALKNLSQLAASLEGSIRQE